MEVIDKHICKTCNKEYSSYSSLWNHTKNIHKNNIKNIPINSNKNPNNSNIVHNYNCRYCEKTYDKVKTRWAHEQKCKIIFFKT
jgi:protein-arginine kinase activator protein McsA